MAGTGPQYLGSCIFYCLSVGVYVVARPGLKKMGAVWVQYLWRRFDEWGISIMVTSSSISSAASTYKLGN